MRPFYAILFVFALSTPTMAQTFSYRPGTSIPGDGVLKPNNSEKDRVDDMDSRAPLPCDGKSDRGKKCPVRFSGSHLF